MDNRAIYHLLRVNICYNLMNLKNHVTNFIQSSLYRVKAFKTKSTERSEGLWKIRELSNCT